MSRKSKKQQSWRAQLRQRGRKITQVEQKAVARLTWDELHAQEKYYSIYPGLMPTRLAAVVEGRI